MRKIDYAGISRKWNDGHPPFIGWWNASIYYDLTCWRWWNGVEWSVGNYRGCELIFAEATGRTSENIKWTDYWPKNARVPRIDQRVKNEQH
jgi:hypothetical protein